MFWCVLVGWPGSNDPNSYMQASTQAIWISNSLRVSVGSGSRGKPRLRRDTQIKM